MSNALVLVSLAGWLFVDGSSRDVVLHQLGALGPPIDWGAAWQSVPLMLAAALALAVVSGLGVLLSLVVGSVDSRRTRRWLLATALVSLWLALAGNWEHVHWRGQQCRMALSLNTFKSLAAELDADWPGEDGDSPSLGPFLAYPVERPRTLLLLGNHPTAPVSAIERSPDSALRFQLTGESKDVWVERCAQGTKPTAFVGGLNTGYIPTRIDPLGGAWYLVRYAESARPSLSGEFTGVSTLAN